MKMNEITFDHMDVRARMNPPFPSIPLSFNAWPHIGKTVWLDPRRVKFMKGQPREEFRRITRLARGIKKTGQRTTILAHPIDEPAYDVELTAGERRTRACREAGVMIRAEIRPAPSSSREHFVDAVVENFNREDLNLVETVKAVNRLIADGHTLHEIAEVSGKTYTWAVQYATLGTLDLTVLALLATDVGTQRSATGRKLRRKALLPMDIALQVAKLKPAEQLPFAQMLIEECIPVDVARDLVRHRLTDSGEQVVRIRPPKERFQVLDSETRRFEALCVRHLEMSKAEIASMARQHDTYMQLNLARRMRVIADELEYLAAIIDPEIPNFTITPETWHPAVQLWLKRNGISFDQNVT